MKVTTAAAVAFVVGVFLLTAALVYVIGTVLSVLFLGLLFYFFLVVVGAYAGYKILKHYKASRSRQKTSSALAKNSTLTPTRLHRLSHKSPF